MKNFLQKTLESLKEIFQKISEFLKGIISTEEEKPTEVEKTTELEKPTQEN